MKTRKIIAVCLMFLLCLGFGVGVIVGVETGNNYVYAAQEDASVRTQSTQLPLDAYKLEDNTGYRESEDKKVASHPLKKNLINLSLCVQSETSIPVVDAGSLYGYNAYGITGSGASIQLTYNFNNAQELYKRTYQDGDVEKTEVWSISNDSAQQVGDIDRLGVVGTGALIFQKKSDPNGSWEWQTKDGETKQSLHTINFTDVVPLEQYSNGELYTLYTPSGTDLSKGVFIKITLAYEIKITTSWDKKYIFGIKGSKSEVSYLNILETAEFYLVQNSGAVLFHNASTFDKVGDDDGSGAISINDFETILDGDVTLNGFRLDTMGVEAYDIKYRFNGGEEHSAYDGQFFLEHGRYDFTIKRELGSSFTHTIFVDRREVNDAAIGYFGQSLITPDSQRIYTTGDYPTYIAGATWNLNATDGTVAPVVGILYLIDDDGEEVFVREIAQPYGTDYKTQTLQGTIDKVGIYKAEFWGNPRYLEDGDISGDLFHFTYRFEIVDKDTAKEPSINEAYLNGLLSFSDMQSKYYAVILPTAGAGNAIFAFSDYFGAYDFAYEIERSKVKVNQGTYEYNQITYSTQKTVLAAVDKVVKSNIVERYFDSTDPESYQTADVADDKILEMNFTKDVIVFLNDSEQAYMQAGLPTLNGRKYRYISPDTGEITEGVIEFAFLKIADFESCSVTLIHNTTGKSYDIQYGVSVEYQLGLENAPSGVYTVREVNSYGDVSEYEAIYIKPGEMTGTATLSLYRNGKFIDKTFSKDNTVTESGLSGFILKSLSNDLDIYSIVKINHNNVTQVYTFAEVEETWFSEGGVYDFTLADRLGNTIEFSVIISNPVGYADVYLELEQDDETITKYFHVFVGQEIELPIPQLTNDLYVFDGWLYNDELIADNLFVPTTSGAIYVWQQITQKYTYLNFDANGGKDIERIKVEIGEPIELPLTSKDGWTFGGWEYGGEVYNGEYTPTSSSPTFVAIWHYQTTQIELYDGNLYQTTEAQVGDKVILPFPTRTGYTFFGWREQGADNQDKVYYGQITSVANVEYLRLDALWIREIDEDVDTLSGGTGGRVMIHFVDGDLISNGSIQGAVGSTISMPNVTRAGFVFVGWIWETTATSGKIYGSTMTIPADAGNKIVLQALWLARELVNTQNANQDVAIANLSGTIKSLPPTWHVALGGFISLFGLICIIGLIYMVGKRGKVLARNMQAISAISGREAFADKQSVRQRRLKRYGSVTLITAFLLILVMTFISAFGGWCDMGVFEDINVTPLQSNDVIGSTFEYDNYIAQTEEMPTKEEVQSTIEDSGILENSEIVLTDEELFLYALIMIDLYSLGYLVFPAEAILPNNKRVYGLGYSDYEIGYKSQEELDATFYIGSGFVALPRQSVISQEDIEDGIILEVAYDDSEVLNYKDYVSEVKICYFIKFLESYGPCHYIADEQYVKYSVDKCNVTYSFVKDNADIYDAECGALYSYDVGRIVFDPDLGAKTEITATALNTLLEPSIAKGEYEQYITDQTANGFTVDTLNFVYLSYSALESYLLSNQDESFLGIDVQEYYDLERTLGENEYYTVDADGNLTKLEFPHEEEDKATWLDRLAGAVVAIGIICVGVIIVAAVSMVSCGVATAVAPYIMGAFIGAGMEVFMQTVVQGKKLDQVNWLCVGIAAVSGVLSAIPGVGWFGAGLIQGGTQAAMTWAQGGSFEEILTSFAVGFATGVLIFGVSKAISKMKFCFVAGTGVLMASGATKTIENIQVGDLVKSYNTAIGRVENKRVLQTFVNETDELVTISTSDGQQVFSTPGHKFFANNKWISAEDLRAGDILVDVNGEKVIVIQVQHEILDSPVKVYNFEVADNHTYFVGGNNGIAVHNKACDDPVGAYKFEVLFENGDTAWYVGKGTKNRMNVSISQKQELYDVDLIAPSNFEACLNDDEAFILEAKWMNELASQEQNLLNKIASPGFKKGLIEITKELRQHLLKMWWKG